MSASAIPDPWTALSSYELPAAFVAPALALCRGFNTILDFGFYDVQAMQAALEAARRAGARTVLAHDTNTPPLTDDLGGDVNPEGSLLVVDAVNAPHIQHFPTVKSFLDCTSHGLPKVRVASVTGVGSSALGSAALAWNVSVALGEPVLAVVPGYGVADVMLQGLGGGFGYGVHDFLRTKTFLQAWLAMFAPAAAKVGRHLSAPYEDQGEAAPVFVHGSGSADVLHELLGKRRFVCLVGHSKGALTIGNAIGSLQPKDVAALKVVTLGCPIEQAVHGVSYSQFLGRFDLLGMLNAWGHSPTQWEPTEHSTNMALPFSLDVRHLCATVLPLV